MINSADFKKHTLKELDLRRQEIELDVENLMIVQRRMTAIGHEKTFPPDAAVAYKLAEQYGEMIKRLITEQAEIEIYLIENEAPLDINGKREAATLL